MLSRTKRTTAHITDSFSLEGVSRVLPPGDYSILEDEELIEGISWLAYRRIATFIEVPMHAGSTTATQMINVARDDLEAILHPDSKKALAPAALERNGEAI